MHEVPSLLLLAPSVGFGGGIERVAQAIEDAWQGRVDRVNLYRRDQVAIAAGRPQTKAGFSARAAAMAIRSRPRVILALHHGLLPVALAAARVTGAEVALMGIGLEVWSPMSARTAEGYRGMLAPPGNFSLHRRMARAAIGRRRTARICRPASRCPVVCRPGGDAARQAQLQPPADCLEAGRRESLQGPLRCPRGPTGSALAPSGRALDRCRRRRRSSRAQGRVRKPGTGWRDRPARRDRRRSTSRRVRGGGVRSPPERRRRRIAAADGRGLWTRVRRSGLLRPALDSLRSRRREPRLRRARGDGADDATP